MTTEMTFKEFSRHLRLVVDSYEDYLVKGANLIGAELDKSAKEKIGNQQQGDGPFQSWAPLAESTLSDKETQGFLFKGDGNPLYRTGEMMESISFVFNLMAKTLYLGSTSDIALWQELGTTHIPPRSFLGLTMYKAIHFIALSLRYLMLDWITLKPIRKRVEHGIL